MKVTISVGGIWDAFALAEQLERRGYLDRIITSYPRFRLKGKNVSKERVQSLWPLEAFSRILSGLPFNLKGFVGFYKPAIFDALVQGRINRCDIFVGYAGMALSSMRRAKVSGAATILFRNSTHIEFQHEILTEEFTRYGIKAAPINRMLIQKELQEYEEADYIRVPSEFARRTFLERGFDARKILMIPHGVDLENFQPVPKSDGVFRILFVAGISLRKGVQYLLEAVKQLRLPNSEVVLLGGMSDEIRLILKRYEGLFRYEGIVSRQNLYRYYSQGSVYVLPSLEEGMALTVLEAMACGVPVIVSHHTGVESVVRDGREGFIVPIRDVEHLKEKLLYLHENEASRAEMGRLARERVRSFTWDCYGNQVVRTFRELLDRG